MFSSLKVTVIIYILVAAITAFAGWKVMHAFNEAAKVPGLEDKITVLNDYKAGVEKRAQEAVKRVTADAVKKQGQETKKETLRKTNAKSPNITIPPDKLQNLRNADAAVQH